MPRARDGAPRGVKIRGVLFGSAVRAGTQCLQYGGLSVRGRQNGMSSDFGKHLAIDVLLADANFQEMKLNVLEFVTQVVLVFCSIILFQVV